MVFLDTMNWKKQLFEYRLLWPYGQHVHLDEKKHEPPSWSTAWQEHRWRRLFFFITNFTFFLAYSLVFVHFLRIFMHEAQQEKGLIYSPARSAVSYETRVIDQSIHTPYQDGPSLETEAAWRRLLRYNNIVVQQYDLDKLGKTSVPLRDKSGFLAGIDVVHELHCLNYVREHMYADYYQFEAKKYQDEHIYHCIDHLREILMCHGDIAVHTYERSKENQRPLMKKQTTHECRKWEPLYQWTVENEPSHAHGPILEHPILGIIQSTPVNKTQA